MSHPRGRPATEPFTFCGQAPTMSGQSTTATTRRVPRFGPLFYTVLSVAVLLFVGFFGWQTWHQLDRHITTQRSLRNLQDPNAEIRRLAAEQLSATGADYSPILVELLNHEDRKLRLFACEQLGAFRPLDESSLAPLTRSLADSDPMVRCYAAHAIAPYATLAAETARRHEQSAIRQLCHALSDENANVREAAAHALAGFAERSPDVGPVLTAALNDKEPNVRLRAAWSLYEIDHDNLSLMVLVIEDVMSGSDASAHNFVMGIVDALGPVAEDEMPDVVKQINRTFGR